MDKSGCSCRPLVSALDPNISDRVRANTDAPARPHAQAAATLADEATCAGRRREPARPPALAAASRSKPRRRRPRLRRRPPASPAATAAAVHWLGVASSGREARARRVGRRARGCTASEAASSGRERGGKLVAGRGEHGPGAASSGEGGGGELGAGAGRRARGRARRARDGSGAASSGRTRRARDGSGAVSSGRARRVGRRARHEPRPWRGGRKVASPRRQPCVSAFLSCALVSSTGSPCPPPLGGRPTETDKMRTKSISVWVTVLKLLLTFQ